MNWLAAVYQPTTLFSLRPSWTTSSGGKSLLIPSPYATKMALLDVAIRVDGIAQAESAWSFLRALEIGIQLPEQVVVTNLFTRILRKRRNPAPDGSADAGPFQKTIGYREYVYLPDSIHLALGTEADNLEPLERWLLNLTYLGKRGGFVQLMERPKPVSDISDHTMLTREAEQFPVYGLMQRVDDCDPTMKWDNANIYTSSRPNRITRDIVLPYRLKKSSRSYSWYERVPVEAT